MSYPATLPPPLQSGYSLERPNNDVALSPFSGATAMLRQSDDEPAQFAVQWNLDEAQAMVFFDWFENTLKYGTESFTIPLLIEAGMATQTAVFIADSLTGFSANEYGRYLIRAQIFVPSLTDPDAGQYATLLAIAELDEQGDPENAMMDVDRAINEVWP